MNFLRAFLVGCVALQFVMPLLPLWGWFTPHEHIARVRVTARDWQVRWENHRTPQSHENERAEAKILSVTANDRLSSLFGSIDLGALQSPLALFTANDFSKHGTQDSFFARAMDLGVLIPPPNA